MTCLAQVVHDLLFRLVHWAPALFRQCVMTCDVRRRTSGRSGSAFIDRQCFVSAAVARIRVDRTCLRVLIAGRLGQMLSLNARRSAAARPCRA
jgi:hypothetical protein